MRPSKILLLAVGCLTALVSIGLVVGGGTLVWAHATQRDSSGYFSTSTQRFETATYALTSEHIDLGSDIPESEWSFLDGMGTARIVARSTNDASIFVGIARHADVERFLAGTAHDEITDVTFSPFKATYRNQAGDIPAARPENQPFWAASTSGAGRQTLTWDIERGEWDVVVMNTDAHRGVAVEASAGIKIGFLLAVGFALLAAGLAGGAVAAVLVLVALKDEVRPSERSHPYGAPAGAPALSNSYPLRLDGRLDEPLSRWSWLVKWFLVIPHLMVLAFLWVAFAVLTVVAGFAILFTGRYPRAIFDFNVGVLRWTWRVTFYAFNLGTDRYPPFSLEPASGYPAELTVAYPGQLSRPLVLVKWWLLALPHYLVIGIFGGGIMWWTWGWAGDGGRATVGGGLIGILVLVAGVMLAATRRYPRPVFDFVMGMQRWTYRVWAYAALMCDEYPPFRLDNGGPDPGASPTAPDEPEPDIDDRLVGSTGTSQR